MRDAVGAILLVAVLLTPGAWGCSSEPAVLQVELDGEATARPQFFHGNCFAGFSTSVRLRVRETQGVDVTVDMLAYRISDQGSGRDVASETLDPASLDERYGSSGRRIPGRGFRIYAVSGVASNPVGPLRVVGEIRGRDAHDARVAKSFQLDAPLRVEEVVPPGSSGACSLP